MHKNHIEMSHEDPKALHEQAETLFREGKYAEVLCLCERLVAMMEAAHGPNHLKVAPALQDQWPKRCSSWAAFR